MLLAIDTSSRFISTALYSDSEQRILAEQTLYSRNQHTVQLSELIQMTLHSQAITATDLKTIAIAEGPGSYSGLRVGFGVAKGLAMACQLSLIPVPTLDIIARSTPASPSPDISILIAVLQAGRGRIIAGTYHQVNHAWQLQGEPDITSWEKLMATIQSPVLINGEIEKTGRLILQQSQKPIHLLPPGGVLRRAGFLIDIALEYRAAGRIFDNPADVNPVYLKAPG